MAAAASADGGKGEIKCRALISQFNRMFALATVTFQKQKTQKENHLSTGSICE